MRSRRIAAETEYRQHIGLGQQGIEFGMRIRDPQHRHIGSRPYS